MGMLRTLSRVGIKNIGRLLVLCLKNPLFVIPTIKATRHCISVATDLYGDAHHKNVPANGFRHAYWNYTIALNCYRVRKKEAKVVDWTTEVTNWHEEAFPNEPLAKKMDLHNNSLGRNVFKKYKDNTQDEVKRILIEMVKESVFIDDNSNLQNLENKLVHIIQTK